MSHGSIVPNRSKTTVLDECMRQVIDELHCAYFPARKTDESEFVFLYLANRE